MPLTLKKIKLSGFKSFVDPTVFDIRSSLMGVVGPNGCGKSNIIDAVRWVMGESSAKTLRGESMSDVIFNGSTGRSPVGQASVELSFDNSDGALGGEYASYAEIAIRRVATRDNQSSYFLNGVKCRRKDITDVFLGTGLGPRSYAIIEQGMIARVIESKPEDLRAFLEEAAGISVYRQRRRETENRMRHTRENLERINDVRQELEKQLERLNRQSESAKRYKEYKQEQETLEAELTSIRWRALTVVLEAHATDIRRLSVLLEEKLAQRISIDLSLEKLRQEHIEGGDAVNEVQVLYYDLGAQIGRIEQNLAHQEEREVQLQKDLKACSQEMLKLETDCFADTAAVKVLKDELQILLPELNLIKAKLEQDQALCLEAENSLRRATEGFEQFQIDAQKPNQIAEVEKLKIAQNEREISLAKTQLERFEEESKNWDIAKLNQNLEALELEAGNFDAMASKRNTELQECTNALNIERETREAHQEKYEALFRQQLALRGQCVSLEALQQAALHKTDNVLKTWLNNHGISHEERLAQGLKVEPGYETALETVLGLALEAICVPGLEALTSHLESLESGMLMLVEKQLEGSPAPSQTHVGKPLHTVVNSNFPISHLLQGVYIVDDLHQALSLRSQLQPHESLITKAGIWLGKHWLKVYKGQDLYAGVLQREQDIKQLQVELASLDAALSEMSTLMQDTDHKIKTLEIEREALHKVAEQESLVLKTLSAKVSAANINLSHARTRLAALAEQKSEHAQKCKQAEETIMVARLSLETALNDMENFANRRTALKNERDTLGDLLKQATVNMRSTQEQSHQMALKVEGLKTQIEATTRGITRLQAQQTQVINRSQELQKALDALVEPTQQMKNDLEALLTQRIDVETDLNEARAALEAVDHKLRTLEKNRNELETLIERHRADLESLRMEWQAQSVRKQTVEEKGAELNINFEDILKDLPASAEESEWNQRLTRVTERITRLGAINLVAIEEYQSELERKTYLDAQYKDLTESLETLENAIRKIDRETRARFKETFDKVNHSFQTLFPHLFGGGESYLELIGEDLLEAGVMVMARPPGKRNSSIHLLSGGEKALTAVALVFSIFQLNPAPFCLLDEVDAPLDDANVVRFCSLVKHMSNTIQFVFVTHNKTTMEMADHLVGVTMHEPGVSRLVSVDVAEAFAMADADKEVEAAA